jgi:hypothetical protein
MGADGKMKVTTAGDLDLARRCKTTRHSVQKH